MVIPGPAVVTGVFGTSDCSARTAADSWPHPGMHGRSCATRMCVRFRLFAPLAGFSPDSDQRSEARQSTLFPDRNLFLETAFRSPEKTTRFRVTFPESMLLAYLFRSSFSLPQTRSAHPSFTLSG